MQAPLSPDFLDTHVSTASARRLDQFFTRADVAQRCSNLVASYLNHYRGAASEWLWVEPSAGQGAFFDCFPFPKIGLDICSARSDIIKADFLTWNPGQIARKVAVVGNPPFGKNASLARKFFDYAAEFADIISFIVPRTFEKAQFVNRLDRRMHLVCSQALDDCSFEFEGAPYSVPTVFQIWEKRSCARPLTDATRTHRDFDFVGQHSAHFAFQRVGARAGLTSIEGLKKSPQSHYFIKANGCETALLNRLRSINWETIKHRTAGNPSIGKAELVGAYEAAFG
jgi:hypothetical protein